MECAAGKHSSRHGEPSDPTRDYCEDCECPAGQASEGRGLATCNCAGCPAGKFGAGGGKTCTVCPAGKHQPKNDQHTCSGCGCAEGTASNATNVSAAQCTCTACPAGSYGAGDAAQCLNCPAGKFSPLSTSPCDQCPAGRYSDSTLNTNCQPTICPAGRYAPAGSTDPTADCVNCPDGQDSTGDTDGCHNIPSKSKTHTGAIVGGALGGAAAFAALLLFARRQRRNHKRPFEKWFYRRGNTNRNDQSSVTHPLIYES